MIDLRQWMGGYLPMSCKPDPTFHQTKNFSEVFDDTHEEYEVPPDSMESTMEHQPQHVSN